MNEDCLFCKIVARQIPATVVLETDQTLAFRDINPQAPTHVVVVPKRHLADAATLASTDPALAGALIATAAEVAASDGVAGGGYRLVFNTGPDSGQSVFHVHLHVLGGRTLTWPPG